MFKFRILLTALVAVALTLVVSATAGAALPTQFQASSIDLDEMRDYIEDELDDNAVGFGYAIARNGQLKKYGGGGYARTPDDGDVAFTSKQRIEVMSVTKNATAVGVLRLLDRLDISVDEPIHPWLPDEWAQGLGFWGSGGVTFRHLLSHTSGLNQAFLALNNPDNQAQWGNDWDGLEFVVANGTSPGSTASYKNANYALFRILIPALWRDLDPSIPQVTKWNSWELYLSYMQKNLFEPIGIKSVTCWAANPATAPLAYDIADPDKSGALVQRIGSSLYGCGGHAGLHLSARDLVKFQVYLRHTEKLLTNETRALMDTHLELGWNKNSNGSGSWAGKFWHGGDGFFSNGREIHTCVMKFPDNVEASLVVNSKLTGGLTQCGVLVDAFDAAA
jgi:CubicO group peptidase (beta-lactamase class C family)